MWAARSGCDKTSQELLNNEANLDHVNNAGNTPLHIASSNGNVNVVELLLNSGASVCIQNNQGQTCLDVTVQSGAGDVALAIARHKRSLEILEFRNVNQEPPMKILIEHFPEAASLVMDHCIKRSSHIQTDPNYIEFYDFHLLDPGPDDETNLAGDRFFGPTTMVKFNRERLLLHPLTQKLLDAKWASFGRYIYYFNLLTYMIFLITYTIFIVTERDVQDFNPTKSENETGKRVSVQEIFTKSTAFNGGVLFVALIFASAHILKEIFQLFVQRRKYFTDLSNITEWALYLSTLCFMMPYLLTSSQLETAFGSLKDPRNLWSAGIVSIFLCYVNVILFLRRFQPFGIYVSMFIEVFKTVARVFLVFFIFIIAFAIVFFILFKEQDAFRNLGYSIVKVTVMMIGEYEYVTTFIDSIGSSSDVTRNPLNPFPEIALVFIFAFLFLMSIILMNLLVGLAVGDIESVQRTATLQRMAMQVSFVAEVENKYPRFITRRIYNPLLELKPNARKGRLGRFHAWLLGQAKFLDEETSLTPCDEMAESTIYDIRQQVNKTKKRVKNLVRTMEIQNRLLVMMARKMNLSVEVDELDAAGDWVSEAQPGSANGLLGDDGKSEDEKDGGESQVARL
ncbi:hypothetical protein ACROYT_G021521 [Oculina patagonica]